MFNFKKKKLDPILAQALDKMDAILKMEDVTEKTEQLLALKEALGNTVGKMSRHENTVAVGSLTLGMGAAFGTLIFATGGLALPLVLFLGGTASQIKHIANRDVAAENKKTVEGRIDRAVANMLAFNPQAVLDSPRFRKNLQTTFNLKSSEDEFAKLNKRVVSRSKKPKNDF
ncbi:MAG: hypothetical protein HY052_06050 [Proteobacteria bacterium]|nr:hypothetical protein [Pseudomonadota bacterium]